MRLDSQSAYVAKRFALKLGILSVAAIVQSDTPWGIRGAAVALPLLSALLSAGLALANRQQPLCGELNYWDETLFFAGIGAVAMLFR